MVQQPASEGIAGKLRKAPWVATIGNLFTAGTVQQSVGYTYDFASNVQTYSDNTVGGNVWSTTYGYDYANRMLSEVRTGGSVGNFNNVYVYDKNGNRSSITRSGVLNTYSLNLLNDELNSGDGFTLSSYDADGSPHSVVSGGVTKTFTYDRENRVLTLAYSSGGTNTFQYNGDGQRVEKVDSSGTTRYVYDGSTIIADTNSSGTIQNYYLPGVGFTTAAGVQKYYRENALGSNLATTTSTGTVDSRTEYDGYGVEYNVLAGTKSAFKFAGRHGYVTDDQSGLDMLGARYYAPKLGRFLTQDPSGHSVGLNLYAYCNNNPLTGVDPTGLDTLIFNGSKLKWYNSDGNLVDTFPAYSGKPGSSKADQARKDYGPIPEGYYYLQPYNIQARTWSLSHSSNEFFTLDSGAAWGDRRVELHPSGPGDTFGRTGFYLHGGVWIGSAGCIDLGPNDSKLLDALRDVKRPAIKVVVTYKEYKGSVPFPERHW